MVKTWLCRAPDRVMGITAEASCLAIAPGSRPDRTIYALPLFPLPLQQVWSTSRRGSGDRWSPPRLLAFSSPVSNAGSRS